MAEVSYSILFQRTTQSISSETFLTCLEWIISQLDPLDDSDDSETVTEVIPRAQRKFWKFVLCRKDLSPQFGLEILQLCHDRVQITPFYAYEFLRLTKRPDISLLLYTAKYGNLCDFLYITEILIPTSRYYREYCYFNEICNCLNIIQERLEYFVVSKCSVKRDAKMRSCYYNLPRGVENPLRNFLQRCVISLHREFLSSLNLENLSENNIRKTLKEFPYSYYFSKLLRVLAQFEERCSSFDIKISVRLHLV